MTMTSGSLCDRHRLALVVCLADDLDALRGGKDGFQSRTDHGGATVRLLERLPVQSWL